MFSDLFVGTFIFLYNAAPYALVAAIILTALNGVRKLLRKRRERRARERHALAKSNHFPTFDVL